MGSAYALGVHLLEFGVNPFHHLIVAAPVGVVLEGETAPALFDPFSLFAPVPVTIGLVVGSMPSRVVLYTVPDFDHFFDMA